MIPIMIMEGLNRYLEDHVPTGGFLRAVLENDLQGAVARADLESMSALKEIVFHVRMAFPIICYGNPEKVQAWIDQRSIK